MVEEETDMAAIWIFLASLVETRGFRSLLFERTYFLKVPLSAREAFLARKSAIETN
jgi:hypothetical protein